MNSLLKLRKFGYSKFYGSSPDNIQERWTRNPPKYATDLAVELSAKNHDPNVTIKPVKRKKLVFKMEVIKAPKMKAIQLLRVAADQSLPTKISYQFRRNVFNNIKWEFYKEWKGYKCGACKVGEIEHIHHILMLKNGGMNTKDNLIGLCRECHCLIHDWMKPC